MYHLPTLVFSILLIILMPLTLTAESNEDCTKLMNEYLVIDPDCITGLSVIYPEEDGSGYELRCVTVSEFIEIHRLCPEIKMQEWKPPKIDKFREIEC